jgi:hypothetical protein
MNPLKSYEPALERSNAKPDYKWHEDYDYEQDQDSGEGSIIQSYLLPSCSYSKWRS